MWAVILDTGSDLGVPTATWLLGVLTATWLLGVLTATWLLGVLTATWLLGVLTATWLLGVLTHCSSQATSLAALTVMGGDLSFVMIHLVLDTWLSNVQPTWCIRTFIVKNYVIFWPIQITRNPMVKHFIQYFVCFNLWCIRTFITMVIDWPWWRNGSQSMVTHPLLVG